MYPVKYHKPDSVSSATAALGGADDGKILGGGQTLLPTMKAHLAAPSDLVDVRSIPDMQGVSVDGDTLVIGAATTHAAVSGNADVQKHCPALACLAGGIGDPAVRAMGTMGGSLANNDPAADYPAALLALGGTVVTNSREIAAGDYFQGMFETALEEGEIITAIKIPATKTAAYAKFPQPASLFAMVGVFVAKGADGVRVAVTGAGDEGVFRHAGLEAALGDDWSEAATAGVDVSEDGMLADIHASAAYRANLVKVMAGRAVAAA